MLQARFPGRGRGKQRESFEYEWVGGHAKLKRPAYDFPRTLFETAIQQFAGRPDVLGAFDDRIAARNPASFGAWVQSLSWSPRHHACYVAGILCHEFGVVSRVEGPRGRVLLTFPEDDRVKSTHGHAVCGRGRPYKAVTLSVAGLEAFSDNDEAFIDWCRRNPTGWVWNCTRNLDGEITSVGTLHGACAGGDLCQHFRNKRRAGGYEVNLTTQRFVKVCSKGRAALQAWAEPYPGHHGMCSSCIGLP